MSRRSARQTSGLRPSARGSRSAARRRSHHRRLAYEPLEERRLLALLTVGNVSDLVNGNVVSVSALIANPGADGISLREAILATNATAGPDEVQFSATILAGGPATILFTSGELAISDSLTVRGPGANLLTIDASGSDPTPGVNNDDGHRAVRIQSSTLPSIDVTISGMSITGGESTFADDLGAGVLNFGNLTLRAVSIFGNRGHVGGDIGRGGAIANLQGVLIVDSSAIFDNDAAVGGGILNGGSMTIVNSTISGNRAEFVGGGISHGFGGATVFHSTITLNRVDSGEGGSGINSGDGMQVHSSIVAGNFANDDVRGGFTSLGFNLIGGGPDSGAFDPSEVGFFDPLLAPLTIQGGTTPAHPLLPNSPALGAGDPDANSGVGLVPPFDQRGNGFSRVRDGRIDIGALEGEIVNNDPVLSNPGNRVASEGSPFSINGLFTFIDADSGDTHTATVDWGDGSDVETVNVIPASGGGTINANHVYVDDGMYSLKVTVLDSQGGDDEETISVVVGNIAPTLIVGAAQTAIEGVPLNLTGSGPTSLGLFVDPGILDVHTATVNWGDGSPVESPVITVAPGSGLLGASHTYNNTGTYTVSVTVTDDSNESNTKSFTVFVVNAPPSIDSLSISTPINEGQSATLTGTFSDVNPSDTHELDIDWDGDNVFDQTIAVTGGTFNVPGFYADDNPTGTASDTFNVNVRLRDNDTGSALGSVQLTVDNSLPELVVAQKQVVDVGELLDLSTSGAMLGEFTDGGALDTHTATVNWGDSQLVEAVSVSEQGGSGTLAATHVYSLPGTYQVTVNLRDDDGGERSASFLVEVAETQSLFVTTTQDIVANDGETSLREAIAYANSIAGADAVTFNNDLSGQTIVLTQGALSITTSVTIDATALAGGLTIDARGNDATPTVKDGLGSRIFIIDDQNNEGLQDVTIAGVTLTGGDASLDGGAIATSENLTLRQVVITGNASTRRGGGVSSIFGDLTIQNSTISGNTAGVSSDGGGPVSGFVMNPRGGAVYTQYGLLTVLDSTISSNSAEYGGGVFSHRSDVSITGSTFGENSATIRGGGVWIENDDPFSTLVVEIRHTTIYRNTSNLVGSSLLLDGPLDTTISHALIAGVFPVSGPADLSFGTSSPNIEYSLIGSTNGLTATDILTLNNGTGNILNRAPLLAALANNGGSTQTYALLPGSPAVNAGRPGAVAGEDGVPLLDQRGTGYSRVRGLAIDIGALEVQNSSPGIAVPISATITEGSEFDISTSVLFIDPDDADQHTVEVDWGDGTVESNVPISGIVGPRFVLGKHIYGDDGSFIVRVTVTDGFNTTFREFVVDVANVDPTAMFGNDGPIVEGSSATVSFSSSLDAGEADRLAGLRYAYDLDNDGDFDVDEGDVGDGSYAGSVTSTSQVIPAALLADGPSARTIRARIIDKNGGFTDYTTVIDVLNANPVADAGGSYDVDEGQKVRLNATAFDVPGDALTFEWDFDNDEQFDDATGATPEFDAASISGPATIIVRLRVTDGDGGVDFDTATINVRNVPPEVDAGGPYDVEEGDSITLQAAAIDAGGEILVFEWDFDNDGEYDDALGMRPVFSAANLNGPDAIVVGLRVSDGDGGEGFDTAIIIVRNVPPQVDAGGPYEVDEGQSVSLQAVATDVGGDTLTYEWDFDGDGSYDDATGESPLFSAANLDGPRSFTLGLRVSDEDGGVAFGTAIVNIRNVPPQIDAGGPYQVDEGRFVVLQAIASDFGSDTLTYEWDFDNDGSFDDATGASPQFDAADLDGPTTIIIRVRVTDDDGGIGIATTTIEVVDVPPRVDPGGVYFVDEGSSVPLQAIAVDVPGDRLTYEWDFDGDGSYDDATGANPLFSAANLDGPSTVAIGLRVTDDDGTQVVTSTTVEIQNVAPRIRGLTAGSVDSSGRAVLSGEIDDPGKNDRFLLFVEWGDGTTATLAVPAGETTFRLEHQYETDGGSFLTPGIWPIQVTVTDAVDQDEIRSEVDDPPEPFIPFIPAPMIPEVETTDVPSEPFNPPTAGPEELEQTESGFELPTSDGGAGGKYRNGDEGYEPPDDALEVERALQALLSSPRAVRREEIVDAVHELGELELVSLLGFDLGDEPVFVAALKTPKPSPSAAAPEEQMEEQVLAVTTAKPVLPDDSGGISLFWAALGVSGSLWVGGTWWWRRRRQRLLLERASSAAARKTISDLSR